MHVPGGLRFNAGFEDWRGLIVLKTRPEHQQSEHRSVLECDGGEAVTLPAEETRARGKRCWLHLGAWWG